MALKLETLSMMVECQGSHRIHKMLMPGGKVLRGKTKLNYLILNRKLFICKLETWNDAVIWIEILIVCKVQVSQIIYFQRIRFSTTLCIKTF